MKVSFATSLLGLTEPIFVPEYWSPPSLFDLARKTGFDIESIIFAFAIGGIVTVIYELLFHVQHKDISKKEQSCSRHKFHYLVLLSAPVIFIGLMIFVNINPIYSASIAMIIGSLLTMYCRPDLISKMLISALLFTGIYYLFFLTLIYIFPDFVDLVWNISDISGVVITGVPVEELMFAFTFGLLWSSIYEHYCWKKLIK